MTAPGVNQQGRDELSRRLVAAQRENDELLKVVVAARRLGESTTKRDVMAAIREIVVNVIGSEDFAVYLLQHDEMLHWAGGMGCFGGVRRHLRLGEGVLGKAVAGRALYLPTSFDARLDGLTDPPLAVGVPLLLHDRMLGAIAIFRLLPHREPLDGRDIEVLHLLGAQGAAALAIADLLEPESDPRLLRT